MSHHPGSESDQENPTKSMDEGNIDGSRTTINALKMAGNGSTFTITEYGARNTLAVQTPSDNTSAEDKPNFGPQTNTKHVEANTSEHATIIHVHHHYGGLGGAVTSEVLHHKVGGNMIIMPGANIGTIKHEGFRKTIIAQKVADNGSTFTTTEHDARNTLSVQTPYDNTSAKESPTASISPEITSVVRRPLRSYHALELPVSFTAPRPNFQLTEGYKETIKLLQEDNIVVHLYGMQGSGKSQIVRAICKEFQKVGQYMIWHTRCNENSDTIKPEWNNLVRRMKACRLISFHEADLILVDMNAGNYRSFVTTLAKLCVPVLLVVEDVPFHEKGIVQNIVQLLHRQGQSTLVQILIKTRKEQAVFIRLDLNSLPGYKTLQIKGFTVTEAEQFLAKGKAFNGYTESLALVAKELAYSPLRLNLAKSFCEKYCSYKVYWKDLEESQEFVEKEKEILSKHPELGEKHGYEVIMKSIGSENTEDEKQQFRIFKMMSFLCNEDIPEALICNFISSDIASTTQERATFVRHLLERLETECLVSISYTSTSGEGIVSTHQDIFRAVQHYIPEEQKATLLAYVLHTVARLVNKDDRIRRKDLFLQNMMKHLDSIEKHAANILKGHFSLSHPKQAYFEIQQQLSWLYEVSGSLNVQARTCNDNLFDKALSFLWNLINSHSGSCTCLPSDFGSCSCLPRVVGIESLLCYEPGKNPTSIAKKAYKIIKIASSKVPQEFFEKHFVKSLSITVEVLSFMQEKLGEVKGLNWDQLRKNIIKRKPLSEDEIQVLRENKMLLTTKQLAAAFLPERIASIFHSRGRQVLYLQNSISKAEQMRYEWYTAVGLDLTKIMGTDKKVKTIYEYLLESNSVLPRLLQNREKETGEDFLNRLKDARNMAKRLESPNAEFYENGVWKKIAGTPYTTLSNLKYRVKANTKIFKRRDLVEWFPNLDSLSDCQYLQRLAEEHAYFKIAASCRIQCGKYFAAIQKYDDALKAFDSAFDFHGEGIEHHIEKEPGVYAWAVFNLGRCIVQGRDRIPAAEMRKEQFLRRCSNAISANISDDWRVKLEELKRNAESNG